MSLDSSIIIKQDNNNFYYENQSKGLHIQGLPASAGIALGRLWIKKNYSIPCPFDDPIFCCIECSPEDLSQIPKYCGLISSRGGMTSHLAVVGRGMGKPTVTGAGKLNIDYKESKIISDDSIFEDGCYVCVNGNKGEIYFSNEPITIKPKFKMSTSINFLTKTFLILEEIIQSQDFNSLSIDVQIHIAEIKSSFNKINFTL